MINGNGKRIIETVKKTKKKILVGLLVLAIVIIVGILLLAREASKYSLGGATFYLKGQDKDSKLFYLMPEQVAEHLTTLSSEEIAPGEYKVPQHSYISHNGKVLIYFEKVDEIPIGDVGEGLTAYRKVYKPKYVNLKTGLVKDIEQKMDSSNLIFSPDDEDIAWVLSVKETTVGELERAEKKREVWLSDPDGSNARKLATPNDKVILLQKWHGNYIYFWGIQGAGYYSLGKIDVRTGRVKYVQPIYCLEDLTNCQNFRFSSSGELFIYEAGVVKENKETVELFVESLDGEKSWQILVENYISDRLWLPDEKSIIYTEQVTEKKVGLREKIHLVNLETKEDKEIYSGSYISQIVPDASSQYLYFMEKETDKKFNLKRLNIKTGEAEIIDSGPYNQFRILSANQL